ncbi:MAG: hypothetical protein HZB51_33415 [Chloroflexi bacterium]|nr:hypothetical protein [Chloroflexota bacterium]
MSTTTIVLAIVAMGIIALADVSIKQSAGKISSSLGTLVYAITAVGIPLVWTLWTHWNGGLQVTKEGVFWSMATGVWFSIFTGLLFLVFSQGVNLSIGSPVIRMGGIVLAATLGIIVFREGINLQYIIGFLLAAVGIFLVVTR